MNEPLLKTKLYTPRLITELVSRTRLLEQLKTGLQLKLTLITAPAGYGKTTLVSQGVHNSQMPVGWLTLDEGDNDPTSYWSYFIFALQTIQDNIGKSAQELLHSQSPTIDHARAEIALRRSLTRLRVAERIRKKQRPGV